MENGTSAGSFRRNAVRRKTAKNRPASPIFRQNEQREEFPQQRRRDQHGQQVQGTGEVVGIQRQVADAHACLAQVLQRAAGAELFRNETKKG